MTPDPFSIAHVAAYLAALDEDKTPPNTIAARERVLRSIAQITDPVTATREQLEEWWHLRANLSPATRAADLAGARHFYRWLRLWEHRNDDPTLRLHAPKVSAGLPHPINRADLHKLLEELPADLRRATCLGAYAGLRVAEAAALTWDRIDVEARRADILGKGGKWRRVALSPLLIDSILPSTGGNVVTAGGPPYTAQTLQRRVNRAIRRILVDADPPVPTFHSLRHRYGTLAYQATNDLIAVGRQMGHASPVTTAIYAAATDSTADVIAEAVSR